MRVLDLFSGLGGFSQAFKDRGHEVVTVELLEKFKPTICTDIMELGPEDLQGPWDIILASPPCQCFSRASINAHWNKSGYLIPKDQETIKSIALVHYTIWLIKSLEHKYWIMENPMAQLRLIIGKPQATISMCKYNTERKEPPMKRTDLWGNFPGFELRDCKNYRYDEDGKVIDRHCTHAEARRGAKTGTQGLQTAAERAKIPYGLSLEICKAMENGTTPKESKQLTIPTTIREGD